MLQNQPDPLWPAQGLPESRAPGWSIRDYVYCASPTYIKNNTPINEPHDLKAHRIIQFGSSKRPKWTFKKHGGKTIAVPLTASMKSHNGAFLISAAEQDLGIVRVPDFLAQSSLDAGRLVQLLEPCQLIPRGIFIVYPTARYLPHRTRVLMEYLLDNVS